jgi:hypothetical protein
MTVKPIPNPHPVAVARAEALFVSPLPTGCRLSRRQVDAAVAAEVRRRGGVRRCAAEMAAVYGERPEIAVARMRWALSVVASAYAVTRRPRPDPVAPAAPVVAERGWAA